MIDPAEYCRLLERYLCQKNEGHLIRIVGPVFEQVSGWAAQGVPLAIAQRGIDRYCERYYAKGPRRRPVRIEFCEADVLDLFDAWRRAVGVGGSVDAGEAPRRPTLPSHLDRVMARLTASRASRQGSPALQACIDETMRELDGLLDAARSVRGDERATMIDRLREIDRTLLAVAAREIDETRLRGLRKEAEADLAPFASRMTPDAYAGAVNAALDRLVREAAGLPLVAFD
ncbi:MAG TPA: hypothetical protein VFK20_06495 [Vicinamibacterales bacterium]|nr:hypothetical protein [Vicinamibacterales bacterium]